VEDTPPRKRRVGNVAQKRTRTARWERQPDQDQDEGARPRMRIAGAKRRGDEETQTRDPGEEGER
jgi:hypothetical protein